MLLALVPASVAAQNRMPLVEIIQRVEERGAVIGVLRYIEFVGCPQQDAHGVAVFDALTSLELTPNDLFGSASCERASVSGMEFQNCTPEGGEAVPVRLRLM